MSQITERRLRQIISEEIAKIILEEDEEKKDDKKDDKKKVDFEEMAKKLNVGKDEFEKAVKAAKSDSLEQGDNKVLGNVFATLMKTDPNDAAIVMQSLKDVETDDEQEKKD